MVNIPGYRLERRIGTGGQAMVYEAVQHSLDRRVALKILNPVHAGNPEFTRRFLNEGRILASLGHSNAITIHDIGVAGELHYIAMELVEGGDLRARIRAGMDPGTVLDHVAVIADCLRRAHEQQVVHRDIKPANVLFRSDGTLLLTDFGIAKLLGAGPELTLTGTTLGSPSYLSPEQARNEPLDGRADIYSLGAMAFEMLCGHKPYSGDSEFATINHHLASPLPVLPAELAAYQPLIERMMAKSAAERFADAAELIEAVRALRPEIPVPPRGEPAADRTEPTLPVMPAAEAGPGADDTTTQINTHSHSELQIPPSAPSGPPRGLASPGRLAAAGAAVALLVAAGWFRFGADDAGVPRGDALVLPAPPPTQAVLAGTATAGSGEAPGKASDPAGASGLAGGVRPPAAVAAAGDAAPGGAGRDEGAAPVEAAARVQELLGAARAAIEDLRLTRPETDSALFYYDQALIIEPHNQEAREGHLVIAERYAALAQSALSRGDAARARALVSRGLSVDEGNARLLALRGELDGAAGAGGGRQAVAAAEGDSVRGESPAQLYRRIKGWFN